MTNKTKKRGQFKRRTFLKGAAVGAAAVANEGVKIAPGGSYVISAAAGNLDTGVVNCIAHQHPAAADRRGRRSLGAIRLAWSLFHRIAAIDQIAR